MKATALFTPRAHSSHTGSLCARIDSQVVGGGSERAEGGALLSYSANFTHMFRRAPGYVDNLLQGAKPEDLPIQQPTQLLLVVNFKTARTLRLKVSESTLPRQQQAAASVIDL